MIKINAIPLDYAPRMKILPKLRTCPNPNARREPEMSEFDSAFLCGLLKTQRPKKILEVGIAGGATTAIILQALEDIGESYEIHSIDLVEKYHLDKSTDTAFVFKYAQENNLIPPQSALKGTHFFHIGKFLPQVIDEIGGDIDFVILDTRHSMPGEGLDFLAVLPYLEIGAVVVLHDVAENQRVFKKEKHHATTVLFSAVTAEKFLNFVPDDGNRNYVYPNIAAFQITEQTVEYIENVFLTMVLRWAYKPPKEEIQLYLNHYLRYYPPELCKIFAEAFKMNLYNLVMASYL